MIGLVVVSHSTRLASAALELAEQMVPPANRPAIAVAAGGPDGEFGTDASAIAAAIEAVSGPAGVLVLVDLGSAVLSAELALELVDRDVAARARVSPAALVEGLVAALVAASTGADLDEVATQAQHALDAKRLHLGADEPPPRMRLHAVAPTVSAVGPGEGAERAGDAAAVAEGDPDGDPRPDGRLEDDPADELGSSEGIRLAIAEALASDALTGDLAAAAESSGRLGPAVLPGTLIGARTTTVTDDDVHLVLVVPNEHGLHARPAAALARLVAGHQARLEVINLSRANTPVNGASLAGLTRLDARRGDQLALTASGPQAGNLITAILAFAADNFGDPAVPGRDLEPDLAIRPISADRRGTAVPTLASVADSDSDLESGYPDYPDTEEFTGALQRLVLDPDPAGSGLEAEVSSSGARARAVDVELGRFDSALRLANRQLESIAAMAADRIGSGAAAMVSLQSQLLTDTAVVSPVRASIEAGQIALEAWSDHLAVVRNSLEELENPYLRARGQDVGSLERRVRACMLGRGVPDPSAARGVVLVDELDAPTAASLRPDRVIAVLTRRGGDQGHGVMVARQRGIRVVVDVGDAFDDVSDGTDVTWPPDDD